MPLLRQFLIYGIAGAASRLAAVILVPLYTRTLPMSDYGALELLLAVHALVVMVAGMQVESAVAREYFEIRSGSSGTLAWSALYLTLVGTALIGAGLGVLWALGALPPIFTGRVVVLLIGMTLAAQLFNVQLVMLRFAGQPVFFAFMSFCDLALCALFSFWYIVVLQCGVLGALYGLLSSKLLCSAFAWSRTFCTLRPAPGDRTLMARMLRYGVPALPAVLVGWVQTAGSRILLAYALTLADVAVAAVAIKVAALYGFLIYSFRLAWEPFSLEKLQALESDPHVYNRALEWFVPVMFFVCGVGVLLAPYVVRVLAPPEYAEGGRLAIFFFLGQFWVGLTNVLAIGIHGARRTERLLPVYGVAAVVNVVLLLATAPALGVAAAGWASLAGAMCSAFIAMHYSNLHLEGKFNARIVGWAAVATLLFATLWYPISLHYREVSAMSTAGVALFGAGLCLVTALLALILACSFEAGRPAAMLASVMTMARLRNRAP